MKPIFRPDYRPLFVGPAVVLAFLLAVAGLNSCAARGGEPSPQARAALALASAAAKAADPFAPDNAKHCDCDPCTCPAGTCDCVGCRCVPGTCKQVPGRARACGCSGPGDCTCFPHDTCPCPQCEAPVRPRSSADKPGKVRPYRAVCLPLPGGAFTWVASNRGYPLLEDGRHFATEGEARTEADRLNALPTRPKPGPDEAGNEWRWSSEEGGYWWKWKAPPAPSYGMRPIPPEMQMPRPFGGFSGGACRGGG